MTTEITEVAAEAFAAAAQRKQAIVAYDLWVKSQPLFHRRQLRDLGWKWGQLASSELPEAVRLERLGLSICKQAWRSARSQHGKWSSAGVETFSRRFAAVQAYKSIKVWQRCLKEAACKS